MTETDAKALLNDVCAELGIGGKARTQSIIMTNIKNASRRSDCLSKIENLYVEGGLDEDGEYIENQQLNWGEEPENYIETYKKIREL